MREQFLGHPSTTLAKTAIALALPLAATLAHAQNTESSSDVALGTVTVTASGYEQEVRTAPASITILTREELESKQFRSLSDALRNVPGVGVMGGDKGEISIRGMESSHVLIMVDGRRQNTGGVTLKGGVSEGLSNNWIPPIEAIERIEVVRGPMSTLYGSEAMGGVINIVTRKVAKTWNGSVSGEHTFQDAGKAGDTNQADLYLSGPLIADTLGLQFWGSDKRRQEDDVLDGFAKSNRQTGNLRLWFTPNKNHEFMLEAGRSRQEFWTTPGRTLAPTATRNQNEYIRENYALSHKGRWGFGISDLSLSQESAVREGELQTAKPKTKNTVLDGKLTMPLGNHMLLTGFQIRRNELKSDGYYSNPQGLGQGIDASFTEKSLFVEDEWAITEKFSLTGGLRLDDNEYFGRHWTPRLYGVWSLTSAWTLKGGVAKGFQSPTIAQINPNIGLPQRGGAQTWGNPDLKPEESLNREIGAYYDAGGAFRGNATIFDTDYTNKIVNTGSRQLVRPDGTPVPNDPYTGRVFSTYFNITKAKIRGLELSGSYQFSPALKLSGNYTLTDSKVKSAGVNILGFGYPMADGQPLVAVPKHAASATLNWKARENLSAFATVTYRGKEALIAWGSGGAVTESVGAVATLDIGTAWSPRKDLTVNVVAYNLTNNVRPRNTSSAYSYAEDGRRLWVKMAYRF